MIDITIKVGSEIESITISDAAANEIIPGTDTEQVEEVKQWLRSGFWATIRDKIGVQLVDQYYDDNVTEAS